MRTERAVRAALVTAFLALAVAACEDDPAPLFEIPGTGSLEGFVFFDADRNGLFDPSAGDSIVRGARLSLRERGTAQTLAGGTATSGTNGRFTITGIRPGTHDLVVDTTSIPAGMRFCQNPVPVDVRIGESQFQNLGGRIACIISIAEAEKTRDQTVVITGIVTSVPAQLQPQYTYIQDETGGIRIFSSVPEGKGIAIGDRIEVTGIVTEFSRDLQLGSVVLGAIQKNAGQITPQVITTGALAATVVDPASPELGSLVTIRRARIATAFGEGGINGRNTRIDDNSGRIQMRFAVNVLAGETAAAQAQLNALYPVGKCYDITGVTGLFGQDVQIFPRTLSDLVEVSCS